MTKEEYINNVDNLDVEEIVSGIIEGIVTFDELKNTGEFDRNKQNLVKTALDNKKIEINEYNDAKGDLEKLKKFKEKYPQSSFIDKVEQELEELEYNDAINDLESLKIFINNYPKSRFINEAKQKITELEKQQILNRQKKEEEKIKEQREEYERTIRSCNDSTPDQIVSKLTSEQLESLCGKLGISADLVINYNEPKVVLNDVPENPDDIPSGYTDVFFWGIPSSGKTCALAAILATIEKKYSSDAPTDVERQFGATYRASLKNLFTNNDNIGYLPPPTSTDTTQYMPFLLKKRLEKNYRKVSFFELSGEVFERFFEIENDMQFNNDADSISRIETAMKTLQLVLNSNNQKIHFFFIDYDRETKMRRDKNNLQQSDYLNAATYYFRDHNDIFKKKTDAVFVVVTKCDEIKAPDPMSVVKNFLHDNFGNFLDVLKNRCEGHDVHFDVKMFSIGDVFFKRICRLNTEYSEEIIEEILTLVNPERKNWLQKLLNL